MLNLLANNIHDVSLTSSTLVLIHWTILTPSQFIACLGDVCFEPYRTCFHRYCTVWGKRANRGNQQLLPCSILLLHCGFRVCSICYYIHSCNWLVLFFPHTVPRYCRLVHHCHCYPSTKWGQPWFCCSLLFISTLVCASVSSNLIPLFVMCTMLVLC